MFLLHSKVNHYVYLFVVCCSVVQLCPTLCNPMDCSTSGFPVLHHLVEFAQTHVRWIDNAVLCCLLLLPSVFPKVLPHHIQWPKYWSFSFSPSNEYSGLIPFRIDWFDLLAVQGTLQSLLQPHSSKASVLCRSAFFMVQFSHPYMTTGKTIDLTIWTFVSKVSAF